MTTTYSPRPASAHVALAPRARVRITLVGGREPHYTGALLARDALEYADIVANDGEYFGAPVATVAVHPIV